MATAMRWDRWPDREDGAHFALIVSSAKQSGWLPSDSALSYETTGAFVKVSMYSAQGDRIRRYAYDAQWLLQFLRELAHREWHPAPARSYQRTTPAE